MLLARPAPALDPACLTAPRLAAAVSLQRPTDGEARLDVELGDELRCRWLVGQKADSGAVLLRLPDPIDEPLLVEIATDLDARSALVAHVAILDAAGRPLRIAPATSFRERRGSYVLRFMLRPVDVPGLLWIGAAADSWPVIARRNFRGASTRVLGVIGLATGTDRTSFVAARLRGKVTVEVTPFWSTRP